MKKKHSVLVDLHPAHFKNGFAGIPQDCRLLFSALSQSTKLDITGWIYPTKMGVSGKKLDHILSQAILLGFGLEGRESKSIFKSKLRYFRFLIMGFKVLRDLFRIWHKNYSIDKNLDFGVIWRLFFQGKVPFSYFKSISEKNYVFTNLSQHRKLLNLTHPILDTSDFDFVLCQEARYVKFSPNTIPIIRYHDAIPLLFPDTIANARSLEIHYTSLKKCEEKGIFVCNSPSAKAELSKFSPKAAERAHVIPCIVPQMERKFVSPLEFRDIAFSYMSKSSQTVIAPERILSEWICNDTKVIKIPDFIMTLSAIEPRKNHMILIQAWQKLRILSGKNIKLLVVGSPGWSYQEILEKMNIYVKAGDLLHLEKVPQSVLPLLYSSARCFIFPSIAEGFGLPPCEAMQCGCPVLLSDIEAHRFIAGDSACYFSPYNVDEVAATLNQILYSNQGESIRARMVEKGYNNMKRFSEKKILSEWEDLFGLLYKSKENQN